MNVGHINDEGVPLDTKVNAGLSTVCGLAARQRVPLAFQGFDYLIENKKGWTLPKLYSSICSISERAEVEGEKGSYEDHLSCLEDLQK
jgi:hypothetical protein